MTKDRKEWAIVGGGLLGMTIALRLAEEGQQVTIFEGNDRLGGLADSWTLFDEESHQEITWDRHYHVTLLSDQHTRKLLRELDLEAEMKQVETKTGFYTNGELFSMSNTWEFLNFPPLRLIDKLRLGATIFYASKIKNWEKLESISVENWLRKWSGNRTFEKIWLPLLRAKLGENYKKVSATFIWATIARMYAARRTGLKKEMFCYVPGGYARIIHHLSDRLQSLGVNILLDRTVEEVRPTSHSSVRILSQSSDRMHLPFTKDPESRKVDDSASDLEFDQVVLTCPSPVALRICPELTPVERQRHQHIEYQGIVCASVLLKQDLSPYYVTNITDDGIPFTAVIEMSALVDKQEFQGRSLVYLPKYVDPEDPIFQESDASIRERFLGALLKMYPHLKTEDILDFRLSRVRHVFPLPKQHYSENLPEMKTFQEGIWIVNSSQIVNGTLNVNETLSLAERSVQDVLLPENFTSSSTIPSSQKTGSDHEFSTDETKTRRESLTRS